jgi:hypothetical protein
MPRTGRYLALAVGRWDHIRRVNGGPLSSPRAQLCAGLAHRTAPPVSARNVNLALNYAHQRLGKREFGAAPEAFEGEPMTARNEPVATLSWHASAEVQVDPHG